MRELSILVGMQILLNDRFEKLVNRYSQQVLSTALKILGNAELANDVHQEVFLAIWQRWHKFNSQLNWNAYLYKVTVRKAIELVRRSKIDVLCESQPEPCATNDKPDARLREHELQQKLRQCLARLPKRQADVFILSRIEGLKNEKIAELLGCSQQTVRVHLHRAIKRISQQLSSYLS